MGNPRSTNGQRRRQLRARLLASTNTCALCGLHVDTTLPPHLPTSPEVDEITPVSRGGNPLDWHNLQLAHRICNRDKGNATGWTPIWAHNQTAFDKACAQDQQPSPSLSTVAQPTPTRQW